MRRAVFKWRCVVVVVWEWGMTQLARLTAIFTVGRIIYGRLVHVGVDIVVLSRRMI